MVIKYSKAKDGNKKLSDNFTVGEFACRDGSDLILIDTELVKILQKIRDRFDTAVTINSAYRTAAYNKKIGGVAGSQHTLGTAADITLGKIEPRTVAEYGEFLMPKSGGIGLYNGFVHIDVRKSRARWQNFGKEVAVKGFSGYSPKNITTITAAISHLVKKGIINTPAIWYEGTWTDSDFKCLLVKIASYIEGSKVANATAAVAVLHSEGVINTPDIWYRGTWSDSEFKQLLIKSANHIG